MEPRMSDQQARDTESTPVTIYGRTYQLRGSGDPDYLARLADMVDTTMKQVAQSTGTADTLKVAILAALNIADERVQAERSGGDPRKPADRDDRITRLVARLDEMLEKSA